MPPEATAIVQTSAVVGEACDDELLGAVSGSSLDRTRELVDAECRQDILGAVLGVWPLRHELLREVVYDALSSDTRRRLHHRIAQELGPEASRVLQNSPTIGTAPDSLCAPPGQSGGAEADAVHAPAAAHQHLERVLETWEHLPASVQESAGGRDEVLRRAAQAAERAGSFARAAVLAEQRLRLEVGGADERALRLERLARYRWESGDVEAAASAYRAAVRCLEPGTPSGVRAKVLSGQAWFLGAALELAEARAVSQTALAGVTPGSSLVWPRSASRTRRRFAGSRRRRSRGCSPSTSGSARRPTPRSCSRYIPTPNPWKTNSRCWAIGFARHSSSPTSRASRSTATQRPARADAPRL